MSASNSPSAEPHNQMLVGKKSPGAQNEHIENDR